MTDNQPMYVKNQLQLVFQQFWTGLLKDWLQPVATSSVSSCLVFRNLATSPVASCLKFGQKDWTGLDFKTLAVLTKEPTAKMHMTDEVKHQVTKRLEFLAFTSTAWILWTRYSYGLLICL